MKIHFLPRRKQPVSHTKAKPVNAIWEIIAACVANLRKYEHANVWQQWIMLERYSSITGVTVLSSAKQLNLNALLYFTLCTNSFRS
jgi:hypothetical protein